MSAIFTTPEEAQRAGKDQMDNFIPGFYVIRINDYFTYQKNDGTLLEGDPISFHKYFRDRWIDN